ncbi:MAG: hypothetical protein CMJ26_06500 [Phycisphaerae bacterium]|nr:hypothetical protein [Phycisphaerae bacterium]
MAIGCSSKVAGPEVVTLDSQQYAKVFDAAIASANADGMHPVLVDRRSGVITTDPAVAGSFLEPWKPHPSTARQGLENTLAVQRRTARFEFVPVSAHVFSEKQTGSLDGPDLLSSTGFDLTTYEGPMELRVWVYVDRKYTQGIQRGTWTLRQESKTKVLPAEEPWEQVPGTFWMPVSRDVARERDLLASVESRLTQ